MSAIRALAAAQENGLLFSRDGDQLVITGQELPDDLMALVAANKPDLMRVMVGREAARAAFTSAPPPGCWLHFWAESRRGLSAFMRVGWGDLATLSGWTNEELYALPPAWGRLDCTGAALLIGDRKTVAITEIAITTKGLHGAELKFRRKGREHFV